MNNNVKFDLSVSKNSCLINLTLGDNCYSEMWVTDNKGNKLVGNRILDKLEEDGVEIKEELKDVLYNLEVSRLFSAIQETRV